VRDRLAEHKQLFMELAETDQGDWQRYPDFEEFYKGLDTKLDQDDVRRWLRYMIRDEIADARGKAYPGGRALGDPQEDAQLQEAVRQVLQKNGRDIREVPEYRNVLKIAFEKAPGTGDTAKRG
jgi:hypothetical protein